MNTDIVSGDAITEFIKLREHVEGAFLHMGALLKRIRDEKVYEGRYDTFEEFLADARFSKATASKLMQIHEKLVVKYDVPEQLLSSVGWSTLYEIQKKLPDETPRDTVIDWVERGSNLTREDTIKELQNINGEQDRCSHFNTYTLRVCSDCGHREKLYEQ